MHHPAVIFDTHASISRLVAKGIDLAHAEALINENVLLHQLQLEQFATKADIKLLKVDIQRLDEKFDAALTLMRKELQIVAEQLTNRIDQLMLRITFIFGSSLFSAMVIMLGAMRYFIK